MKMTYAASFLGALSVVASSPVWAQVNEPSYRAEVPSGRASVETPCEEPQIRVMGEREGLRCILNGVERGIMFTLADRNGGGEVTSDVLDRLREQAEASEDVSFFADTEVDGRRAFTRAGERSNGQFLITTFVEYDEQFMMLILVRAAGDGEPLISLDEAHYTITNSVKFDTEGRAQ